MKVTHEGLREDVYLLSLIMDVLNRLDLAVELDLERRELLLDSVHIVVDQGRNRPVLLWR
jgi:hypothetical protein